MLANLSDSGRRALSFLALFLVAVAVLAPGIGEITGITGKDEYFLSLRTPLTMMEQDRWLVPWLDEAPRLKKPPMLYWLARASYEVFGPTLFSARLLGVLAGAALVLLTGLIGYRLTRDAPYSLLAGVITLSTLAVAVEGRRLMLDLPCAAFSALSLYLFLRWRERPAWWWMTGSAMALAAGFLTKGPLAIMLFGSCAAAMFLLQANMRRQLWDHKWQVAGFGVLFVLLAAPWFIHVYQTYPDASVAMLEDDVESRQLLTFSSAPIAALILLVFPWSFILLWIVLRVKPLRARLGPLGEWLPLLVVWLLLSLLPFFFFKSFARYMAGSVVPMALLCAVTLRLASPSFMPYLARLGLLLSGVLVLSFCLVAGWFQLSVFALALTLAAFGYFGFHWWRGREPMAMAISSAVLWMMFLGFLYPTLGINAIPERITQRVGDSPVILFKGPQPALLPMVTGKSYMRTKLIEPDDLRRGMPLIFVEAEEESALLANLKALGAAYQVIDQYQTLSSRSAWLNFAKKGATRDDWREAFDSRSLAPIRSTILLYGPVIMEAAR